jgi:hypothetical protein
MRRLRHQGAPSPAARSTAKARTHPVAPLHDLGEPAGLWHTAFPANPALLDRVKGGASAASRIHPPGPNSRRGPARDRRPGECCNCGGAALAPTALLSSRSSTPDRCSRSSPKSGVLRSPRSDPAAAHARVDEQQVGAEPLAWRGAKRRSSAGRAIGWVRTPPAWPRSATGTSRKEERCAGSFCSLRGCC